MRSSCLPVSAILKVCRNVRVLGKDDGDSFVYSEKAGRYK